MLSALSILASSLLFYYIARLLYNVFLHPLASVPGPVLAAATSWYETYFDLVIAPGDGGRFPWEIERLHRVYGPIVRIGPGEVHIDDPAWFETFKPLGAAKRDRFAPRARISNTPSGTFGTIVRSPWPNQARRLAYRLTFCSQDHDLHRSRKMVIAPFFSRRTIAAKQNILFEKARDMCDLIREDRAAGRPTRLDHAYGAYSLDIICEMVMGMSEHVLRDREKAAMWRNTLASIFEVIPLATNFPFIMTLMQSLPDSWVGKMNPYLGFLTQFYKVWSCST